MIVNPHPLYFLCSLIEDKTLKADILSVGGRIAGNAEHDSQDAFKKWQKHWERCICTEGGYFEGDGGQ
jgi:hypothetical protein